MRATTAAPTRPPRRSALDPLSILGVVLLIAAWQLASVAVPRDLVPSPLSVVQTLARNFFTAPEFAYYGLADSGYLSAIIYSATTVLGATACGTVIGTVLGLASSRFEIMRAITNPIALVAGTIPIIIAAPFLLLFFGVSRTSAFIMVAFYVAVVLYTYAQRAAVNLSPIYLESARTFGATRRMMITDVLMPGTLPEIIGGIRIGLAGSWGLEAIAELMSSDRGIGKMIQGLSTSLDTRGIMAALLLISIVALVFDWLTLLCAKAASSWRGAQTQ